MLLESTRNVNLYKGPNSSEAFNKQTQSLQKDIATLFDSLNSNEEDITSNMDILLKEHQFFQKKIDELNQTVKELKDRYNLEGYKDNEMRKYHSFYQLTGVTNGSGTSASLLDSKYGIATVLPTNTTSKLSYESDSGEVFLPNGLEIYARETNDILPLDSTTNERIYSDLDAAGLEGIVDRDANTYWVRNATSKKEDCVTTVFGEIHIKVPQETLNNLYSNVLTIAPYPLNSMTIQDIFCKGIGDQWMRLPNFPTKIVNGKETPIPIEKAGELFLSFEKMQITELRILYAQPYWIENASNRVFSYGFQGIDLQYQLYTGKDTEFVTKITTSNPKQYFQSIELPEAIESEVSEHNLTDLVEFKLYYDENMSTEFDFGSNILAPLSTVYIKTILKRAGDKTPVIKEIIYPYYYKTTDLM